MPKKPKVAIFSPNPMVSIAIESFSSEGGDDIHIHPAGQGVWVARMAAELGAEPVLCGFIGGEVGTVLRPLLEELPVELRLVEAAVDLQWHGVVWVGPADREQVAVEGGGDGNRKEVVDLVAGGR